MPIRGRLLFYYRRI